MNEKERKKWSFLKNKNLWVAVLCVMFLCISSLPADAAGGQKKVQSGITYQVVSTKKKTAQVVTSSKNIKNAKIASTVKIKGKKYKVVAIQKNAFKGRKKLKSVTISKNVTKIGNSAFANCKKLKTVKITSYNLKKIDKKAFSGVYKKTIFQVPSSKYTDYIKLIAKKDRGWKSTMTIKGSKKQVFTGKKDASEAAEDGYTYAITPMLAPFNEYFYVQTDNPDPSSFRLIDKKSKYSKNASISLCDTTYCDVVYEKKSTHRVKGGYIFYSGSTDGGTIKLQVKKQVDYATYEKADEEDRSWVYDEKKNTYVYYVWSEDKNTKIKLDTLYDESDYLINTYAGNGTFFEKMNAVEAGFNDICLYSGSYVKGTLQKEDGIFWGVSAQTHVDQSFYIFSPYTRKDNKSLFASALYPFRYDSLGFPSVMATVSKRLDASSSYKWNSDVHYLIDVTYGGETKSYGGAGNGEGQGLTEDKLKYFFRFDGSSGDSVGTGLEQIKQMLSDYAQMDVADDIPRDDELTWKKIADTVGDAGAWIKVIGGYSYVYRQGDGTQFYADEWYVGYSDYFGGDLGYGSDTWVDGRYIGEDEVFEKGAAFADHPTSSIIMLNYEIPYIINYDTYTEYNWEKQWYEYKYRNVEIGTKQAAVKFYYDSSLGKWKVSSNDYYMIETMVSQGVVDQSVLDKMELTTDEVNALGVDANTNTDPAHGYIYDQTVLPGTTF